MDQAIEDSVSHIIDDPGLKKKKIDIKETQAVDTAIDDTLNDFHISFEEKSLKEKKEQPKSFMTHLEAQKLPFSFDFRAPSSPEEKQTEILNYFDKGDLEAAKSKNKVVYLNDSTLNLVKPSLQTSLVFHKDDVHKIFLVFLVFILAGEFFSAPAITLADSCTLQLLGPNRSDLYGRQRMFGSLGWALAMFAVGLLLDNAKAFTNHPCGKAGPDERNYTVCFAIYAVLMGFAFVVATQFNFDYGDDEEIPLKSMTNTIKNRINQVRGAQNNQFNPQIFVNEFDENDNANHNEETNHTNGYAAHRAPSNAVESGEEGKEKYMRLFHLCKSIKYLTFLFIVWFMGIGVGLVFTFLFWHLQDLGGSPSLYGIASVINHVSELMAYFIVHKLVRKYGHIKIFYAGLFGNGIRFLYVSILSEPAWILPFEFIQGEKLRII